MRREYLDIRVSQLDPWQPRVEGTYTDYSAIDIFAFDVQNSLRGVKFGTAERCHPFDVSKKLKFVYMDGQPYVLGYIFYDDPRDNAQRHENHFVVCSPHIVNNKYATYSVQRSMRMSVNKESALKYAKAFLRPRNFGDLAKIGYKHIRNGFSTERSKYVNAHNKAREAVGLHGDTLIPELSHLIDMGHNFLDADIHEKVLDLLEKNKEMKRDQEKKLNAMFVYAFVKHGKEVFKVIDLSDEGIRKMYYNFDWDSLSVNEYTSDTLPGDIKSKLVSLNMLEGEGFVDDVGYKAGDNMFYVAL